MRGLGVLRDQTHQFIADSPTDIVLTRTTTTDDGAGGVVHSNPTDLPAQTVRVVTQRQGPGVERRTTSGETVRPDLVLIAEYDADIAREDFFTHQGLRMEVVWVNDLGYEKMVEVAAT